MLYDKVSICGTPVNIIPDKAAARELLSGKAWEESSQDQVQVAFINAHVINCAVEDEKYRALLNGTDFNLADGIGIWLAGKFRHGENLVNLNGTDFGVDFLRLCADRGKKVFLLGAKEGVAEKAAAELRKKIVKLEIAGFCHGFTDDAHIPDLLEKINSSGAEVLYVCMGVPHQEFWIQKHLPSLPKVRIAFGLGAFFDFHSGLMKRAPEIIRKFRLEWAYRLMKEPRRMFHRYVTGNFKFIWRAVIKKSW